MINYEITKIDPQRLFMQVRYFKENQSDYWTNFKVTDFSEENVHKIAADGVSAAGQFWDTIGALPTEVALDTFSGTGKRVVHLEAPLFDQESEIIEPIVTETDDAITHSWNVRSKTDNERVEELENWRFFATVTPRQARLALAMRGQLSNIDTIIASLPEEQQEVVQIEWEYAVSIERKSPWVIQLGSALGLDEEGLDELFKAAALL